MSPQRSDETWTGAASNGLKGMPWWVKAITIFGTTAAIAMYLVYSLPAAAETNALVKAHIQMSTDAERMHQVHERALERILIAICINDTTTFEGRQNCLQQ